MYKEQKALLLDSLRKGRDDHSLEMLQQNPELCDEEVICLALDHSCIKTIRYLREHGLITMKGKVAREHYRKMEMFRQLEELRQALAANNNGNQTPKGGSHGTGKSNH